MNIGAMIKWGSILMNMAQDQNIHMICRGAWGEMKRLKTMTGPKNSTSKELVKPSINPMPSQPRMQPTKPNSQHIPSNPKGMNRIPSGLGIQRIPSASEIQRMLADQNRWLMPGPSGAQRLPAGRRSPNTPAMPEYPQQDWPFPWMAQQSTAPGPTRQKRNTSKR